MLNDFPKVAGQEREDKILECVRNGRAKYEFAKITSKHNNHTAEFLVFEDALKVDGIRVNVTAKTQQQIADLLYCTLPTAKICDLMYHLCEHRIIPFPRPITSTTQAMIEHSQNIDKEIVKLGSPKGLKSSVGKTWIIDNSLLTPKLPDQACNYGWHIPEKTFKGINGNVCASLLKNPKTGLFWYMIQSRGFFHNYSHSDYSQTVILVSRQCWVDGKEMDIREVFSNPELAPLANHDGVLRVFRQPKVPELDTIIPQTEVSKPENEDEISWPPESPTVPDIIPSLPKESTDLDIHISYMDNEKPA